MGHYLVLYALLKPCVALVGRIPCPQNIGTCPRPFLAMEELLEAYRSWGRASKVAVSSELSVCAKLVETLKSFNKQQCEAFVKDHQNQPLLYTYSFDGATSTVTHKFQHRHAAGAIVRAGRQSLELLMQRLILRTTSSRDATSVQHLFAEPTPMSHGKSSWFIFDAACKFFPLPRSLGHHGVCVYQVVADRLQLSAVARLLQARQEGFYREDADLGEASQAPSPFLHLRDVFVLCGCSLHDIQNALRWSVQSLLKGDVLKECHIGLEALRNSTLPLMQALPGHLATTVQPRPAHLVASEDARRQFWCLLGVQADKLELVMDVDPWVDSSGILWVNPAALQSPGQNPYETVSQAALYLLKWRVFSESRFLSMGVASQGLLGSWCVGLPALVAAAKHLPSCSAYHINGFDKLQSRARYLMVVLAVVSALVNELLSFVMADDRLVLHHAELRLTPSMKMCGPAWQHWYPTQQIPSASAAKR